MPKSTSLYNLEHYHGKRHVATLMWNLPYAIIRDKLIKLRSDPAYPKGSYFKPKRNIKIC